MKKLITKENLVLLLILLLLGHNVYLQFRVEKSKEAADNAYREANWASDYASSAASYASDAVDYAQEAAQNAEEAYDAANEASDYAYKAYKNSFGYNCWSCP